MNSKSKNNKKQTVRTPQQKRSIETRNRIINAAMQLFSEKGFYATNSKEIAAAAGVSIGSFYSYFEEKEPLFLEILTNYSKEINTKIFTCMKKELCEEQNIRKILPIFIKTLLAAHNLSPKFHREVLVMMYSNPKVQKIMKQEEQLLIDYLVSFFRIHQDQIKVKDIEAAALIIRQSTEAVIHSAKIFGTSIDESRIVSELTNMISAYLFYEE